MPTATRSRIFHSIRRSIATRRFCLPSATLAAAHRAKRPYALYDHGFRCVIAPSFGDIFAQNAVKNGLLTAVVPEPDIAKLAAIISANTAQNMTVDLERQEISCANLSCAFAIDPVSRNQLLNGWDDVDLTESYREKIAAFRADDKTIRPWATPSSD